MGSRSLVVCLVALAVALLALQGGYAAPSVSTRSIPVLQSPSRCLTPVGFSGGMAIISGAKGLTSLFAVDIDGDGDNDVVYAAADSHVVGFLENRDGHGTSWVNNIVSNELRAVSVFASDVNNDGFKEIFAASNDTNQVVRFTKYGKTWAGAVMDNPFDLEGPSSIFAGDIDANGSEDIVVAFQKSNTIQALLIGSSTVTTISSDAPDVSQVFLADVNGDNKTDVVAVLEDGNVIAWYDYNGVDSWTRNDVTTEANGVTSIFVADLDGDGDVDIVATSADNATVIYSNGRVPGGSVEFTATVIDTSLDVPTSVFAADLNGDKDLDLIVVSKNDSKVTWFNNVNNGDRWTAKTIASKGLAGPVAVFASDINGDGTYDLVVAGEDSQTIVWFAETCELQEYTDDDDDHTVGWAVATGVVGLFLVSWLLLMVAVAIYDYSKWKNRKKNKRHQEPLAINADEHHEEAL